MINKIEAKINPLRSKIGSLIAESLVILSAGSLKRVLPISLDYANNFTNEEATICSVLRRFPYWANGHLVLGQIQLNGKKKLEAYASSCAASELLGKDAKSPRLLLSQVYMQTGREKEAINILEELLKLDDKDAIVREELAAGYLYQDKKLDAKETLEAIPPSVRSARVIAALKYLTDLSKNIE